MWHECRWAAGRYFVGAVALPAQGRQYNYRPNKYENVREAR
jgi:hypothetical protein